MHAGSPKLQACGSALDDFRHARIRSSILLAEHDQAAHTSDFSPTSRQEDLFDECHDAGVVVGVVVERDVTTGNNPRFEMAKVARDILVIMQTINEKKGDWPFPGHLPRTLNVLHDLIRQAGGGDVTAESLQGRTQLANFGVCCTDPAVVWIDGMDACRWVDHLGHAPQHDGTASAKAANLHEGARCREVPQGPRRGGNEQIGLVLLKPTLDRLHLVQDRFDEQQTRPPRAGFRH